MTLSLLSLSPLEDNFISMHIHWRNIIKSQPHSSKLRKCTITIICQGLNSFNHISFVDNGGIHNCRGKWGEGAWGVMCVDLFYTLFIFNLKFKTLSTVKNPSFLLLQQKEWNPNLCTQKFHFEPFPRSTTSFLKTYISTENF